MFYFIVNEKSGSGRGALIWQELRDCLEKQEIKYVAWCTEYAGHAVLLAERLCEEKDEDIHLIVIGGDGTVNEVLNGMTCFEHICFGLIPTGSGNDLARGLGITGTPIQQLHRLLSSSRTEPMDLGKISFDGKQSSRLFAISSGIGMDALVCRNTNQSKLKVFLNRFHLGKLSYLLITIYSLFTMKTAEMTARFDQETPRKFQSLIFSAAMNFRAEGGGIPMSPHATARDGKLSVCTISGIPKGLTFFCLPLLALACHERLKAVRITDCSTMELFLDVPMTVHADGEDLGDHAHVRYECLPGKLRLMV